jgi:2-polyprenyl-3-methyl-5-hydroxy-6-metoxy-1,4-benzoquinol methylase
MEQGERQVAPTIEGIRRDHVARYEWAAKQLRARPARVIDVACGIGYGAQDPGRGRPEVVTALDRDAEAIAYARRALRARRACATAQATRRSGLGARPTLTPAVCFETIEHLRGSAAAASAPARAAPLLLASVPNEDVFPFDGTASTSATTRRPSSRRCSRRRAGR